MKKSKPAVANNKPVSNKPAPVNSTVKPIPAKSNLLVTALCILIPVCTIFIYGKTLNYPLDKLDERPIFSNIQVFTSTHPSIWESVYTDAFFGNKSDVLFYRPIQNLSYLYDISVWGAVPFGVHLTNLILFICIAYVFLYLLTLFEIPLVLSCLVALLFCCHPLYAISVVWKSTGSLPVNLQALGQWYGIGSSVARVGELKYEPLSSTVENLGCVAIGPRTCQFLRRIGSRAYEGCSQQPDCMERR